MNDLNSRFLIELPKLEAVEFLGVCRVLKVKLMDEQDKPRDFSDLLNDLMEAYSAAGRARKKELLKIVKEVANARRAKNSKTD